MLTTLKVAHTFKSNKQCLFFLCLRDFVADVLTRKICHQNTKNLRSTKYSINHGLKDFIFMPKYIAFLRAINVGGHTVKMDYLKSLFEKMDFENVETFIASGNVVFETKFKSIDAIKKKIEIELEKSLGYKVATFIRTTNELKTISEYKAFIDSDLNNEHNTLYIGFLDGTPFKENQNKVFAMQDEANEFHFNKNELYWLCRKNFSDSGMDGKKLEKAIGMNLTMRNLTTVRKIAAKFS